MWMEQEEASISIGKSFKYNPRDSTHSPKKFTPIKAQQEFPKNKKNKAPSQSLAERRAGVKA